jgi:hypothetical protein
MVLLELFVSRKKKNRASYWQPRAWLDGLHGLPLLRMSVSSSYSND